MKAAILICIASFGLGCSTLEGFGDITGTSIRGVGQTIFDVINKSADIVDNSGGDAKTIWATISGWF